MYGYGSYGWVARSEFMSEEDVGQLGLAVATPGALIFEGSLVVDDTAGGCHDVAHTGQVDDSHVRVGLFCRL